MYISFITDLKNMTYEHYLNHRKPMVEWKLNEKISENPDLVKLFGNNSHPLVRRYNHFIEEDEED